MENDYFIKCYFVHKLSFIVSFFLLFCCFNLTIYAIIKVMHHNLLIGLVQGQVIVE